MMKRTLDEAAELFRQNELIIENGNSDLEKANLYRGLALLAEGLRKLERRLDELEGEMQATLSKSQTSSVRAPRRKFRAQLVATPNY